MIGMNGLDDLDQVTAKVADRLGDQFWQSVRGELRGVALAWWTDNQDQLAELGKEVGEEIFENLQAGHIFEAKMAIASVMTREQWKAYKAGTTTQLSAIAQRRAALLEALSDLGSKTAQVIGKAALLALGL